MKRAQLIIMLFCSLRNSISSSWLAVGWIAASSDSDVNLSFCMLIVLTAATPAASL